MRMLGRGIILDYDGADRAFRSHSYLQINIARRLQYPAEHDKSRFGQEGATRLADVASELMSEIRPAEQDEADVDCRGRASRLQRRASSAIGFAKAEVARSAMDPASAQNQEQLDAFTDHLDRFVTWLERFALCEGASCRLSASCYDRGETVHTFYADKYPYPPRCLRMLSRDVEMAKHFVEAIYGDLLTRRVVRAEVQLGWASRGTPVVSGQTKFREGARLRLPANGRVCRTARVDIWLPRSIDADNSFAITYVAAHEIGIHVVQQIGLERAPRRENSSTTFSEGMVEAALFEGMDEVLQQEAGRPRSPVADLSAYRRSVKWRHGKHVGEAVGERNASSPKKIERGADVFVRLHRFGDAGVGAGVIRVESWETGKKPVRQIGKVRTGTAWARRVVLAMNVMPLDKSAREAVVTWLETRLAHFNPPEELFGKHGKPDQDLDFSTFYNLLSNIARNPYSRRTQARLLKAAGIAG